MSNNGYFITFWLYIWENIIKNSVVYKALKGIYNKISQLWKNSIITSFFRKKVFSEDAIKDSFIGRILFSPFSAVEAVREHFGEKISALTEHSIVVRVCNYYLHNLLALNLRFIGVLMAAAALVDLAVSLVLGGGIVLDIAALIIALVLSLFDVNLTDYLAHSGLVKLIFSGLGEKPQFNFYYVTKCEGTNRLICAAAFGALAGAVCAFLSPILAAALVLGLLFVLAVLYKTEIGVYAALFLAPLIPTMALVGVSLLCLFSLIVRAVTSKKFEWRFGGVGFLILAMLIVYLLSSVISFARLKSLTIWAVYFAFMIFYFVIINTMRTKKQLFGLLTVFVISGFAVCLYGIMQYVFGWNTAQAWMDEDMFGDIKMRIYSTLENPNVLGEYILLVLPVCVGIMWSRKGAFTKTVYGAVAVVMFAALILTFSRGCWIGIMLSAAVFATLAAGKLWGLALLALPFVPMILPESIVNRFLSIGDMKDSSTSYRVYIWMGTLLMLKDFWVSGIGPGTEAFAKVYPFYSYSAIVAPHSHNLFLQIIVESGIVGIAVFIGMLFLFVKRLSEGGAKCEKGSEEYVMLVSIAAAVLGFLLQGMFDNCFYNYRVFMIFWCVIAVGIALAAAAENSTDGGEAAENG